VPRTLLRLRRTDPAAAQRAEAALDELLGDGGLADLTQHALQAYLWYTLAEGDEPQLTAAGLASFFELAELHRYAGIAQSAQTKEILRAYEEQGSSAGAKVAVKAMDASGIVPPDLPELEWGDLMGSAEVSAYDRIAATLELALAAGELKPGGRGWRLTQQRLTRHQLTMARLDGPPLLDRVRSERLDTWTDIGGHERRALASSVLPDLLTDPAPPRGRGRADRRRCNGCSNWPPAGPATRPDPADRSAGTSPGGSSRRPPSASTGGTCSTGRPGRSPTSGRSACCAWCCSGPVPCGAPAGGWCWAPAGGPCSVTRSRSGTRR
jgi:hypothetical protein